MRDTNSIGTSSPTKVQEILEKIKSNVDPDSIDKEAIRLLAKIDKIKGEKKDSYIAKNQKFLSNFARMHEFDKYYLLAESLPPEFAPMSIKMTKAIVKENNCATTLEKSLAEVITNAFCRILFISTSITRNLGGDSVTLNQSHINYYNLLSKELDKTNRQYLMALTTLQQLKTPQMKVSLRAETAIVGQNQQFNSMKSSTDLATLVP